MVTWDVKPPRLIHLLTHGLKVKTNTSYSQYDAPIYTWLNIIIFGFQIILYASCSNFSHQAMQMTNGQSDRPVIIEARQLSQASKWTI